jgi:hypothetical protein
MAKIGILTHHHVHTEGAVLQAYAQTETLKRFGDAEIVDIRLDYKQTPNKKLEDFIEQLPLSTKKLVTNDYDKALEFVSDYDVLVVGADEVWKLGTGKYGKPFPNIYWLHPELKCKKVAFGASANRLNYRDLGTEMLTEMSELLGSFDYLGVRDAHTLEFLNYIGLEGEKIPDPAIAFTFPETEVEFDFNKPVLGLRLNKKADKDKRLSPVIEYFKNSGYEIVSVSYKSKHADRHLELDPLEWANIFKMFDFCITVSYHAAIFSLKSNVPFLVVDVDKKYRHMESKTRDILRDLNLLHQHGESDLVEQIKGISKEQYDLTGLINLYNKGLRIFHDFNT